MREHGPGDDLSCAGILERAWNLALPHTRRRISVVDFQKETELETISIAHQGTRILGFASVWEPDSFIHHLYVDPGAQRSGIGSALLEHVCRSIRGPRISLKTQSKNRGAIRFYEAHGFRPSGKRGEDEFGSWLEMDRSIRRSSIRDT